MNPFQHDDQPRLTWRVAGTPTAGFSRKPRWRRRLEPVTLSAVLAIGMHSVVLWIPYHGLRSGHNATQRSSHLPVAMQIVSSERELTIEPLFSQRFGPANAGRTGETPRDAGGNSVARPVSHFIGRSLPLGSQPSSVSAIERTSSGEGVDKDFFPPSALDIGPYPAQPVLIDYPSVDAGSGTHVSELSLFIDENGRVVRIRVDGPALPAAMEEAARLAFTGATFSPGQVDGLPVRSRIRVEVIFEEGSARR